MTKSHDITENIRRSRLRRGLTLATVANRAGISVSTLSKLETGKMALTYDRLANLAAALETDLAELVGTPGGSATSGRRALTRAGEGADVAAGSYAYRYLATDLLDKMFTPIWGEITARSVEDAGGLRSHGGDEFVYVLEGAIELHTDLYAPLMLKTGDSLYFDATMAHAYVAATGSPCRMLSICAASRSFAHTQIDDFSNSENLFRIR